MSLFKNVVVAALFALFFSSSFAAAENVEPYTVCTFGAVEGIRNYFTQSDFVDQRFQMGNTKYFEHLPARFSSDESWSMNCPFSDGKCDVIFVVPSSFPAATWSSFFRGSCSRSCAFNGSKVLDIVVLDPKPGDYKEALQTMFGGVANGIQYRTGVVNPYAKPQLFAFLDKYTKGAKTYRDYLDRRNATLSVGTVDKMGKTGGTEKKSPLEALDGTTVCSTQALSPKSSQGICDDTSPKNIEKKLDQMLEPFSFKSNPELAMYLSFELPLGTRHEKLAKKLVGLLDDSTLDTRSWLMAFDIAEKRDLLKDRDPWKEKRKKRILEAFKTKPFSASLAQYLCRNSRTDDLYQSYADSKKPVDPKSLITLDDFPSSVFSDAQAVTALGCFHYGTDEKKLIKWNALLVSSDPEVHAAALISAPRVFMSSAMNKNTFESFKNAFDRTAEQMFDNDPSTASLASFANAEMGNSLYSGFYISTQSDFEKTVGISSRLKKLLLDKIGSEDPNAIKKVLEISHNRHLFQDPEVFDMLFSTLENTKNPDIALQCVEILENGYVPKAMTDDFSVKYAGTMTHLPKGRARSAMVNYYLYKNQTALDGALYRPAKEQENILNAVLPNIVDKQQVVLDMLKKETDPEEQRSIWLGLMSMIDLTPQIALDLALYYKKQSVEWQFALLTNPTFDYRFLQSPYYSYFLAQQLEEFKKSYERALKENPGLKLESQSDYLSDDDKALEPVALVRKSILRSLQRSEVVPKEAMLYVLSKVDWSEPKEKESVLNIFSKSEAEDTTRVSSLVYEETEKMKKSGKEFEKYLIPFLEKIEPTQVKLVVPYLKSFVPENKELQDFIVNQLAEDFKVRVKDNNEDFSNSYMRAANGIFSDEEKVYTDSDGTKEPRLLNKFLDYLDSLPMEEAYQVLMLSQIDSGRDFAYVPKAQDFMLKLYSGLKKDEQLDEVVSILRVMAGSRHLYPPEEHKSVNSQFDYFAKRVEEARDNRSKNKKP